MMTRIISPTPPSDLALDVTLMASLNFLLLNLPAAHGAENGPHATSIRFASRKWTSGVDLTFAPRLVPRVRKANIKSQRALWRFRRLLSGAQSTAHSKFCKPLINIIF